LLLNERRFVPCSLKREEVIKAKVGQKEEDLPELPREDNQDPPAKVRQARAEAKEAREARSKNLKNILERSQEIFLRPFL